MFHMLLLEENTMRKRWINEIIMEFEFSNSKEYKYRKIQDSVIYAKELKAKNLLKLYYLIA